MIKKRLTTTLQLGMAVFMMLFATNLVPIASSVAFADELTDPALLTRTNETSADEVTPQLNDATNPVNNDANTPSSNDLTSPRNNSINDNNTPNPLANIVNNRLVNEIVVAPTDVCPNVPGDQVTVPAGLVLSESGDCHVTICHRDAASNKPYVQITVAVSAADNDLGNDNGRGDHFAEHTGPVFNSTMQQGDNWGDIIPPIPGIHDGLNWSAEGQAIYNNDCAPAVVTVIDVCPNIEGNQTTVPAGLVKVGDNCVVPEDNGTVLGVSTVATIIKAPAVGGQGQLVDTGENPIAEMLIGLTIFSLAIGSAILTRKVTPQTS